MLAPAVKHGYLIEPEGKHLRCMFPDGSDAETLEAFFDKVNSIDADAGAPTPLLFIATTERMLDAGARRVIYKRHAEFARHRVAVLGTHALQGFIVNFLVLATGHKLARYFTDEASALEWLGEAG